MLRSGISTSYARSFSWGQRRHVSLSLSTSHTRAHRASGHHTAPRAQDTHARWASLETNMLSEHHTPDALCKKTYMRRAQPAGRLRHLLQLRVGRPFAALHEPRAHLGLACFVLLIMPAHLQRRRKDTVQPCENNTKRKECHMLCQSPDVSSTRVEGESGADLV